MDGALDVVILVRKGCALNRYVEAEEELRRLFAL
jgi:RNase P protein component